MDALDKKDNQTVVKVGAGVCCQSQRCLRLNKSTTNIALHSTSVGCCLHIFLSLNSGLSRMVTTSCVSSHLYDRDKTGSISRIIMMKFIIIGDVNSWGQFPVQSIHKSGSSTQSRSANKLLPPSLLVSCLQTSATSPTLTHLMGEY